MNLRAALVSLAVLLAACGSGNTTRSASVSTTSTASSRAPVTIGSRPDSALGQLLVDGQGMTLYRNADETSERLVCDATCASTWPPLLVTPNSPAPALAKDVTGTVATVSRPDGTIQVTYNNLPLYRFVNDHQPGDTKGQGVGNVWFAVTVNATLAAPSTATSTTAVVSATSVPRPATSAATTTEPPTTTEPLATTAPPTTTVPTTTKPPPTTMCPYPPCY